ncbi:hypothetical protein [Bacteroides faecium]|jgi:hypothetical protein|uniref:Uncharacterized protein n=1 Tax=Bacteroides faecium TaxID=2715212 RepID=A0A6H0KQ57_9BACE|nr:hypothetical protein [Bacteroides faecium]QIU95596.1 hypothetical protein BacF7301_16200 [Bacteroides faecium]
MVKEFSVVSELKAIREQKSRLSERENELSAPVLSDLELIPVIYEWFKEVLSEMAFPPQVECITQRKKFLFIVLFLFSPSVLAGGRMPNGVRKSLEEVFPNVKPCTISNNLADVVFLYQQYKDFRQDIEYIYTEIVSRLKFKGLIN